jgi:hypothetical protein
MEILYNREFLFTCFYGRYERVALQRRGGAVLGVDLGALATKICFAQSRPCVSLTS